ncbi:MAG TPA: hypothetical protein VGB41_04590 [Acidimicrobiia bacterium]
MRSRSERAFGFAVIGLIAALPFLGSIAVSNQVIVSDVAPEDLYAVADSVIVEGTVRGDLFVITGSLSISGTVEGDVIGMVGGPARISGRVDGSVRLAAVDLEVTGSVGDDVAALVGQATVSGGVGRDAVLFGAEANLYGTIGRDVRAQLYRMGIDGLVGHDVQVRVDRLRIGSGAQVVGDVLYRASRDAAIEDGATLGGQVVRTPVLAPVWAKALTRVLSILSVLGLIVAGIIGQWLFRGTSRRAFTLAGDRPGRAALVGLGMLLVPPILVLPLFLTVVGIPIALVVLLAWLMSLFLGPLPAVTRLGAVLVRGKGGLALGLVVGVLVWRGVIWLLPVIAAFVYLGALLIGLGSYGMAAWALRSEHPA